MRSTFFFRARATASVMSKGGTDGYGDDTRKYEILRPHCVTTGCNWCQSADRSGDHSKANRYGMQSAKRWLYPVSSNDAPARRVMSHLEGRGRAYVIKRRSSGIVTLPSLAQTTDLPSPPRLTWQNPVQPQSAQMTLFYAAVSIAILIMSTCYPLKHTTKPCLQTEARLSMHACKQPVKARKRMGRNLLANNYRVKRRRKQNGHGRKCKTDRQLWIKRAVLICIVMGMAATVLRVCWDPTQPIELVRLQDQDQFT